MERIYFERYIVSLQFFIFLFLIFILRIDISKLTKKRQNKSDINFSIMLSRKQNYELDRSKFF
jgi:hypothetical protein